MLRLLISKAFSGIELLKISSSISGILLFTPKNTAELSSATEEFSLV